MKWQKSVPFSLSAAAACKNKELTAATEIEIEEKEEEEEAEFIAGRPKPSEQTTKQLAKPASHVWDVKMILKWQLYAAAIFIPTLVFAFVFASYART